MEEPEQLKRAFINAVAGAVSGAIYRTVTSPLGVIKIRFQVQPEPTSSWALLHKDDTDHQNIPECCRQPRISLERQVYRDFGVVMSQHCSWLCLIQPYSSQCCTIIAGSSKTEDHIHLSPYLSYVSGAVAGCAATVGSYPFDLIRIILASQGEPKVYPHMRFAFVDIIRNRAFQGLYAGLSPTPIEIIPYDGLQSGTYDTFKCWCMSTLFDYD